MLNLIITIFYQPFLNALVLVYWALDQVMKEPDMGIAVIIFTVLIRIFLLPLTIASTQSEDERRLIGREFEEIRRHYEDSEPLVFQQKKKELIEKYRPTIRFEFINLTIQVIIAVILWRIFGEGLAGKDLHLLYDWMPEVDLPFNLTFLGKIDLTKPSLLMNFLSSSLLFLVETLNLTFSPIPPSREDRLVQFLLPILVFFYLFRMPAGKKFFIVVTLIISTIIILVRETRNLYKLAQSNNGK